MKHAPLRVVLFGNSFASLVQLPALRWAGGNAVVGIAGRDAAKARDTAKEWGIEHASGDWRELLELEPDLAIVSTPVDLHHEMVLGALGAGAAVLCEKPFALHAGEAEEMVERAAGRGAWIDHQMRWSPHFRRAHELIRGGFLGEPWHASIEMLFPPASFRERPWRWWFDAERGGGVLGAIGSHALDLVYWLLGEFTAVRGDLRTFVGERPDPAGELRPVSADEFASLQLHTSSGWPVDLLTSVAIPSEHLIHLQLTGSEGCLRFTESTGLWGAKTGSELEPLPVDPELPPASHYGMEDYGYLARCLPLYLRDLVGAVRAGESHLDAAASFQDGLAIQRVLDAARCSSVGGGGWQPVEASGAGGS